MKITLVRFALVLSGLMASDVRAEARLELIDQHGAAVADAVLSIRAKNSVAADGLVVVDQINKQFVPKVAITRRGQRVHFPNSDDVRHHVYSFSKAKTFELKLYSGNASEPLLFDSGGLVVLGCNIHDRMVGYIYVADDELAVKTDAQGLAHLPIEPDSFAASGDKISIWHPLLGLDPDVRIEQSLPRAGEDGVFVLKINLQTIRKPETKSGFRSRFQ